MTDFDRIAELIDQQDFTALFIAELGWDNPSDPRPVRYVDDESAEVVSATPVASKRGVVVYRCERVLDRATLEALDREVSKRSVERLLILTEGGEQQWRWPEPRKSGGTRYVTHNHLAGAPNPALVQRLAAVQFDLDEEADLTVLAVRERVRAQFNADEVTSRFYDEFRENQQSLMEDIDGIDVDDERSWYSSLLLNRLMFIYFMQRKGFLNGDQDYLRTSLRRIRELEGPDRFYDYYRDFLIPLFHEGLGSDEEKYDDERVAQVIGDVPYVNGGIFALHPLEEEHEIRVPDETFERMFDFFDRYRWHLDERPSGNPEEINPEILGYIFEKYVNQKEQGAYYTKEDVTAYMAVMTILPVVIDRIADATGSTPWALLQEHPARYIPEGVRYGWDLELPATVDDEDRSEVGILDAYADADIALPGERWRETVARRDHARSLERRLASGEVADTKGAVTANLDLQLLTIDWIADLGHKNSATVWSVIDGLKIIDPTCGSGAFLFAALDVLEELYDSALTIAEKAVANGDAGASTAALVADVAQHASREYFLMKRAVLANLYGVDLMPEATEIARLRLFLALVARLRARPELEPLPDLDMNIRPGNLLVGGSTAADAERRFQANLLALDRLGVVARKAEDASGLYRTFVEAQREGSPAATINELKRRFQEETAGLRDELDLLYSPHEQEGVEHDRWRETHRPFHWFVEFPEVMAQGGFDAVIGNPPYVAKSKVKSYSYSGFKTDKSPDIYAPCMERAASLVGPDGAFAMIVPISFQFSDRGYDIARKAVLDEMPVCWASTYSRNPSALFDAGLGVRSTIVVGRRGSTSRTVSTTVLRRWWEETRPYLFDTNSYYEAQLQDGSAPWPRLGTEELASLFQALTGQGGRLAEAVVRSGPSLGFKQTALYYLSVFIDEPPSWDMGGNRIPQTKVGTLSFRTERVRDIAFILLAGRLGVWWWGATGDDFDVTAGLLKSFPISPRAVEPIADELITLSSLLRIEQQQHPLVTKYAGKEMGNYDMSRCRHVTDEADQLVLEHLGLSSLWSSVLLVDAALGKVTGERPGTRREWPFPL